MKTWIKILILIGGIAIVGACIFVYMRIIMAPPMEISEANQYVAHLQQQTARFNDSIADNPEDEFMIYSDLTDRFLAEQKITEPEARDTYAQFILVYAPKFTTWVFKKFREPEWDSTLLDWIEGRANYLGEVKNAEGLLIIAGSDMTTREQLGDITSTIASYREARSIAASRYTSLADSRSKTARAKELSNHPWLKYNTSLITSLRNLPEKLGQGHFASLSAQVASLANYRSQTKESYDRLTDKLNAALTEYSNNARNVYGSVGDVASLRSRASDYMRQATDYYDELEYNRRNI